MAQGCALFGGGRPDQALPVHACIKLFSEFGVGVHQDGGERFCRSLCGAVSANRVFDVSLKRGVPCVRVSFYFLIVSFVIHCDFV